MEEQENRIDVAMQSEIDKEILVGLNLDYGNMQGDNVGSYGASMGDTWTWSWHAKSEFGEWVNKCFEGRAFVFSEG